MQSNGITLSIKYKEMMTMELFGQVVVALLAVFLVSKILIVCRIVIWRPYAVTRCFRKQGIIGPCYRVVLGSLKEKKKLIKDAKEKVLETYSHDIIDRVSPYLNRWSSQYGEPFLFWNGMEPVIYITDIELIIQVLQNKSGLYYKPEAKPSVKTLLGKGLTLLNGKDWAKHRKILNPAFNIEKLKVILSQMATCIISILKEWESHVITSEDQCKTIEMHEEFVRLTADVIAHAGFGTSYKEGKEAFKALIELEKFIIGVATMTDLFLPGSQYLPTPTNIKTWKLDRKLKNTIRKIIEGRLNAKVNEISEDYGNDVLGLLIGASTTVDSGTILKLNMDEIVDECKTFLFAGHGTTALLLTWTVYLLCVHPEWQSKLREEVLKEFGRGIPDADILSKLKLVNMVLLESLRLYGPTVELSREALEDMNLGNIRIPKHTRIVLPVLKIHRSKEYWGEDADEFNPLRFADGISKAGKHPHALLPFSTGPRICIGQSFAMFEAKMGIALILQRFSLSLSLEYKHAPVNDVLLKPQFGIPVIVKPLH